MLMSNLVIYGIYPQRRMLIPLLNNSMNLNVSKFADAIFS